MGALISFVVSFVIGTAILHLAVKIAAGDRAKQATFGKTAGVNVAIMVLCGLLSLVPLIGWLAAVVAGFVIVMQAYGIGVFRALLVWIAYIFIVGGLTFVTAALFGLATFSVAGLAALFG